MSDQPDMEPFLKAFSVGFLLRSALAGVFFPVAFCVATKGDAELSKMNIGDVISSAIPLALLGGVFAYGIHRSVVYPTIEWMLNSRTARNLRKRAPLISKRTIFSLKERWRRASEPFEEDKQYARHLTTWADYTHLLYASTMSIAMGAAAGVILSGGSHPPYWPLWGIGMSFFFCGFISDWREHSVEESLCETVDEEYQEGRRGTIYGSVVFFLLALVHLMSLIFKVPVSFGSVAIPMWASGTIAFAFFVFAFLIWL